MLGKLLNPFMMQAPWDVFLLPASLLGFQKIEISEHDWSAAELRFMKSGMRKLDYTYSYSVQGL
jgi:hypothetical protein